MTENANGPGKVSGDADPAIELPEAGRAVRAITLGAILGSLLAVASRLRSRRGKD